MNISLSAPLLGTEDPSQTHNWLSPEGYEILWSGIAALIAFALLAWKAWPVIKNGMASRTERIQNEIDEANAARAEAEREAGEIRNALGDIDAERARLLADADAQAEAILTDGRRRLEAEVADLEAKAEADLEAAAGRTSDELRGEIVRYSSDVIDRIIADTIDDDAHERLIEDYIAKVGASAGASDDG